MASVYRNPGRQVWMMRFTVKGRLVRLSSGTTSKMKAQDKADELEVGKRQGKPVQIGTVTLDEAADLVRADYRRNNRRSLKTFNGRYKNGIEPFFGGCTKLADIRTADITAFVDRLQEHDVAPGTINRHVDHLRRMFHLAVEEELIVYIPGKFKRLSEEGRSRTGFLEEAQFHDICNRMTATTADAVEVYRDIATVAYITGWRTDSEILPLEWRHIDLAGGELRLDAKMAKNKDGRVFPLTPELRAVFVKRDQLRQQLRKDGILCQWVWVRLVATLRGGAAAASPKVPKRIANFYKAWKRAAKAAGYPGSMPHDARRTAIRYGSRQGLSEGLNMKLRGHKTRKVFDLYNIISDADLREASAKLAGALPMPAAAEGK